MATTQEAKRAEVEEVYPDTHSDQFLKLVRLLQAHEDEHPEWDAYAEQRAKASAAGSFDCSPSGAYQEAWRRIWRTLNV